MRRFDRRHHRDVGRCDPGQAADLAEVIRRHLQNSDALLGAQLAQRDGQPVEAVVVGPILENSGIRGNRTEHRGDRLLGRRFSYTAGDADNLHLLFRENETRPVLDRLTSIRHDDAGGARVYRMLAEDTYCAAGAGVSDVIMAVGALGLDRKKELSRPDHA